VPANRFSASMTICTRTRTAKAVGRAAVWERERRDLGRAGASSAGWWYNRSDVLEGCGVGWKGFGRVVGIDLGP
jgi:hypothetical protein